MMKATRYNTSTEAMACLLIYLREIVVERDEASGCRNRLLVVKYLLMTEKSKLVSRLGVSKVYARGIHSQEVVVECYKKFEDFVDASQ